MSGSLLVVRADASTQQGTGHVMRQLALAAGWQAAGGAALLATADCPEGLRRRAADIGITVVAAPPPADTAALEPLLAEWSQRSDATAGRWLTVDGYLFPPAIVDAGRAAGYRVLVVDDLRQWPQYTADIVLNQNLHGASLPYLCADRTLLLLGPQYALLRPEFAKYKAWQRSIPAQARKLLVTLGGSDPENVTLRVVRAIQRLQGPAIEAQIVVGAANPHAKAIAAAAAEGDKIRVLSHADNMPELMAWADLAMTAGGTTLGELAYMQLPALAMEIADNQHQALADLAAAGVLENLGPARRLRTSAITAAIDAWSRDAARRAAMARRGRSVIDGQGTRRVIALMRALDEGPANTEREVRPATAADGPVLWRLSNDSAVLATALDTRPSTWEDYRLWLDQQLQSKDRRMWVLACEKYPVAQARYERRSDDEAMVSFSVAAPLRRQGLANELLGATIPLARRELGVTRLQAVIRPANRPSMGLVERLGFRLQGPVVADGVDCVLWELNLSD